MEILQTVWMVLTTPNEIFLNILGIFSCLIEAFVTMLLFTAILDIKTDIKSKLIYVISFSMFGILSKNLLPNVVSLIANVLFAILSIKFVLGASWTKSITSSIFPLFLSSILETVLLRFCLKLFTITYIEIVEIPLFNFLFTLSVSLFIYIFYLIIKHFKFSIDVKNMCNKNKLLLILTVTFGIFAICLHSFLIVYYSDSMPLSILLIGTLSLLGYFFLSLYSIFNTYKLETTTKTLEEELLYNRTLTILHDSIRDFKHNFHNTVQAIGGYLDNNDLDGLKKYYFEILDECNRVNNLTILSPELINNPAIYNIIATKHHYADQNKIQINLGVFMDLNEIEKHMKIYDFCKILGILLDNAIEAANECKEKIVNICFKKEETKSRILLIIENTYLHKNINIEKIFDKAYSTKSTETNSGFGLWDIKQMLKKANNLNLFTDKTEDYFIQQFEIFY